jgi:ankyrin repeat protein
LFGIEGLRSNRQKFKLSFCNMCFVQNVWGHTALLEAVCYGNKDAVCRLLDAGCDVTLREVKAGDTALHVAVRKNYSVIAEQLLAAGAGLQPVYNYQVSFFDGYSALFCSSVNCTR